MYHQALEGGGGDLSGTIANFVCLPFLNNFNSSLSPPPYPVAA